MHIMPVFMRKKILSLNSIRYSRREIKCKKIMRSCSMCKIKKIINLDNDLLDHTQKLRVASTFALERENLAKEVEEQARLAKDQERLV